MRKSAEIKAREALFGTTIPAAIGRQLSHVRAGRLEGFYTLHLTKLTNDAFLRGDRVGCVGSSVGLS